MAEHAAGTFVTAIRYRGRREGYWMQCLSPDVLSPKYFGLLSPAGTLLGWFSLAFTVGRRDWASFGIVIKPPWRDKGLGTAATRHALARKDVLLARPAGVVINTTRETNARMLRIAAKLGLHDQGMIFDAGRGASTRAFATLPITMATRTPS
ncbi:MAG: GNAT family N-acetyltransferase [Candidatus Sigynarchaeota archaeon]